MAVPTSRREDLISWGFLAISALFLAGSLTSLRRGDVNIAPMVGVAVPLFALTLLVFWRRLETKA